jgi:hypothetical protein
MRRDIGCDGDRASSLLGRRRSSEGGQQGQ